MDADPASRRPISRNGGGAFGIVGAAACIAAAPWLVGPRWLRLVTVGLTAAALVGTLVIEPNGVDFEALGPTWFAVALFTGLPFLSAIVLMLSVDRVATATQTGRSTHRWVAPAVLLLVVPLSTFAFVIVGGVIAVLLPIRRRFLKPLRRSARGTLIVRAVFAAVPIMALVGLAGDLRVLY
ncbi:hypothetical protein [Aeromicrobium sp.]|uniref:hypothetical protein n=1 Tax=Aeromicrobium sp. TaxID=1871063 RepID=UPI003C5F256D